MANIIRSAKSGSDWGQNELLAYNISLRLQTPTEFFSHPLGSIDHLDANLLSTADPTDAIDFSDSTYRFLASLDLATRADYGMESAIDAFATNVLQVTRFDERGTSIQPRFDIPLSICGDTHRFAKTDVCLRHLRALILLVVQEDKTSVSPSDPVPQVIAEAIATFQYNNEKRVHRLLHPLGSMTIPCIVMIGTRPFFYKVPITTQLNNGVVSGMYPPQPTIVTWCAPPPPASATEGMENPDYRRVALQFYDAFRHTAKECWAPFLDGFVV